MSRNDTLTAPAEVLIRHAWDLYEQGPTDPNADTLRDAVWRLEEATDYGRTDQLPQLGREVVQALAVVTGDEVGEILDPMPGVAEWLSL